MDGADGQNGIDGQDGTDGIDGLNSLIHLVNEPSGDNCEQGGWNQTEEVMILMKTYQWNNH